jgi:hypothetical protein
MVLGRIYRNALKPVSTLSGLIMESARLAAHSTAQTGGIVTGQQMDAIPS